MKGTHAEFMNRLPVPLIIPLNPREGNVRLENRTFRKTAGDSIQSYTNQDWRLDFELPETRTVRMR